MEERALAGLVCGVRRWLRRCGNRGYVAVAMFADPLRRAGQSVLDNSALASWVQAVGSIGTIAVGVWAVLRQLRAQREEAASRDKQRRAAELTHTYLNLRYTIGHAKGYCMQLLEAIHDSNPAWAFQADSIQGLLRTLDVLDSRDLPSYAAGRGIALARIALTNYLRFCRDAESRAPTDEAIEATAAELRTDIKVFDRYCTWALARVAVVSTPELVAEHNADQESFGEIVDEHFSPSDTDQSQSPPQPGAGQAPTADPPPTAKPDA